MNIIDFSLALSAFTKLQVKGIGHSGSVLSRTFHFYSAEDKTQLHFIESGSNKFENVRQKGNSNHMGTVLFVVKLRDICSLIGGKITVAVENFM